VSTPLDKYLQIIYKAQLLRVKTIAKIRALIERMPGAEALKPFDLNGYAVWGHREYELAPKSIGEVLGVDTQSIVNRFKVTANVDTNVITELINFVGNAVGRLAGDIDFDYVHSEWRAHVVDYSDETYTYTVDYTGLVYKDDLGYYVEREEDVFEQRVPTRYYFLIRAKQEVLDSMRFALSGYDKEIQCECADGRTPKVDAMSVISVRCPALAKFIDAINTGEIYEGLMNATVYTLKGAYTVKQGTRYIIADQEIVDITTYTDMLYSGELYKACPAVEKYVACAAACTGVPVLTEGGGGGGGGSGGWGPVQ